ncbi:MAG: MFS transporter [Deltaproteobacteria bacterium]|nr:MFS transporter [Deltaproteobacteria bacterium]
MHDSSNLDTEKSDASNPTALTIDNRAIGAITLLTLVNLFNYIDRFIIAALFPDIERELGISHFQSGLLATAFILVYALTSPVFGWGGDRGVRTRWIGVGVAIWSVATALAGFAKNFATIFAARATVGVGEAAYATISPALLSDLVPKSKRGRAMAVFFLAIPVGSALGYILGGVLGSRFGWRHSFFIVGAPGLLLALLLWFMRDPERGRFDDKDELKKTPLAQTYKELLHNRTYLWTVAGYIAYTFAIGGLANWMPSYIRVTFNLSAERGMLIFGGITVVTGILGTLLGGAIGDLLQARSPNGYAWLNIVAMVIGAGLAFSALTATTQIDFLWRLALGELFIFANTGPVNAQIVNTVRPSIRATASATAILAIHVLGDAISPPLIGAVADKSNLAQAMLIVPACFLLAGILWFGTYQRTTKQKISS